MPRQIFKIILTFQNPLATIEEERREHQAKMAKMEKEMEEVFERKVREKKNKLADSEADLEKRHRESKDKLESQKRDLEAQRAAVLVIFHNLDQAISRNLGPIIKFCKV